MTGEVAGLFPKDELDMIVNDMRPVMKKEYPGMVDTWDNLYSLFPQPRVRDNLHTCLCFSPSGINFRHARNFPGADQRVHHRLVLALAPGGAHRGVHAIHRRFPDGVFGGG